MDRRIALSSIVGMAGAGVTLSWSRIGLYGKEQDGAGGGGVAIAQPPIRQEGSGDIKAVTLAQVPIGGGGFVTGLDISSDGQRMACRTDVANAYVRDINEQSWRPLFSPMTMLPSDYDPLPPLAAKADGQGVAGIRIAPSDRNVIFASYYGFVWRSTDGGKSIRRTRLPQKTMLSNAGVQRLFNRTIDIHPRDPQRVVVGTWGDGVWFTADGGDNWDRATLPETVKSTDGQPGIYLLTFDPVADDRLYVFISGVGLFSSDAGPGGEFRALAGGPTHCSSMVIGRDGTLFLCEQTAQGSGGKLWRNSPTAGWASGTPEYEMQVVAADPAKANRIVAANPNGYFVESLDGGRTFRSIGGAAWDGRGEVGWTRVLKTLFPSQILIDPRVGDRLWVAQGFGVAKVSSGASTYQSEDWSAGIEELCAVSVLCVPGGRTFLSAWDKSFWRLDDLTSYANEFRYPVRAGKTHSSDIVAYGSYMDFAADDPRFLVGVVAPSETSAPGFSTNGGDSWQAFKGTPDTGFGVGGCIACNTKDNIVLLPSNNGVGVYTLDGGATWSPVKLDGNKPTDRFANAYYVTRKNISADKTRPGTFALVYTIVTGSDLFDPLGGVWLTKNGGKTWDQVLTGVVSVGSHDPKAVMADRRDARQFWQCQLEYVPGYAGELVYTPHADYADDQFFWSKDDGKSWFELNRKVRNVVTFGFGKAAPGQARPAVFFWGEVSGKEGLYVSFDWFATVPRLLTRFPSLMLAKVASVTGDPDRFGRAFVSTSCAGWVRVEVEM